MYLEIPKEGAPKAPPYKIAVKTMKTSRGGVTFFYNKVLGIVGMRGHLKKKIVCFAHIPGHDSSKARLQRGKK